MTIFGVEESTAHPVLSLGLECSLILTSFFSSQLLCPIKVSLLVTKHRVWLISNAKYAVSLHPVAIVRIIGFPLCYWKRQCETLFGISFFFCCWINTTQSCNGTVTQKCPRLGPVIIFTFYGLLLLCDCCLFPLAPDSICTHMYSMNE